MPEIVGARAGRYLDCREHRPPHSSMHVCLEDSVHTFLNRSVHSCTRRPRHRCADAPSHLDTSAQVHYNATMQHIISWVTIKGGAGKTTLALATAAEWRARGRRVMVVDLDGVQRSSLRWSDKAATHGGDSPDVIAMGDAIKTKLASVTAGYDVVILDTPGRAADKSGERVVWAMGLSHLVVMPCPPPAQFVWATKEGTFEQVGAVRARRPDLDAVVCITQKRAGTVLARHAREAFDGAPYPVLGTELDAYTAYDYAYGSGLMPATFEPGGAAAEQVRTLVDELEVRLGMRKAGGRGKAGLRAV